MASWAGAGGLSFRQPGPLRHRPGIRRRRWNRRKTMCTASERPGQQYRAGRLRSHRTEGRKRRNVFHLRRRSRLPQRTAGRQGNQRAGRPEFPGHFRGTFRGGSGPGRGVRDRRSRHQEIPDAPPAETPVFLAPDVSPDDTAQSSGCAAGLTTADKLRDQYKKIGDAQKHVFGVGAPGTMPPNFNLKVPGVNAPADAARAPDSPTGSTDKKATGATDKKASATTPVTRPPAPPAKEPQP